MTPLITQLPLVITAVREHLVHSTAHRVQLAVTGPRTFGYRAPTSTGWILAGSVYMRNGEWQASSHRAYGPKYDETAQLSLVDVANRIRTELKAAAADAEQILHGLRFSVRKVDHNALHVDVDGLTDVDLYEDGRDEYGIRVRTDRYKRVQRAVETIVDAYNYNGSDITTDYFDVRFFKTVTLVDDQIRAWEQREKARRAKRYSGR